jgi:hypothetical protein
MDNIHFKPKEENAHELMEIEPDVYDNYEPFLVEADLSLDQEGNINGGFPRLSNNQQLVVKLFNPSTGSLVKMFQVNYDYEVKRIFEEYVRGGGGGPNKTRVEFSIFDPAGEDNEEALAA